MKYSGTTRNTFSVILYSSLSFLVFWTPECNTSVLPPENRTVGPSSLPTEETTTVDYDQHLQLEEQEILVFFSVPNEHNNSNPEVRNTSDDDIALPPVRHTIVNSNKSSISKRDLGEANRPSDDKDDKSNNDLDDMGSGGNSSMSSVEISLKGRKPDVNEESNSSLNKTANETTAVIFIQRPRPILIDVIFFHQPHNKTDNLTAGHPHPINLDEGKVTDHIHQDGQAQRPSLATNASGERKSEEQPGNFSGQAKQSNRRRRETIFSHLTNNSQMNSSKDTTRSNPHHQLPFSGQKKFDQGLTSQSVDSSSASAEQNPAGNQVNAHQQLEEIVDTSTNNSLSQNSSTITTTSTISNSTNANQEKDKGVLSSILEFFGISTNSHHDNATAISPTNTSTAKPPSKTISDRTNATTPGSNSTNKLHALSPNHRTNHTLLPTTVSAHVVEDNGSVDDAFPFNTADEDYLDSKENGEKLAAKQNSDDTDPSTDRLASGKQSS